MLQSKTPKNNYLGIIQEISKQKNNPRSITSSESKKLALTQVIHKIETKPIQLFERNTNKLKSWRDMERVSVGLSTPKNGQT